MDKINFCGLKNIGYFRRNIKTPFCDEKFLNIQLVDDFNGKDLTEFKQVMATSEN